MIPASANAEDPQLQQGYSTVHTTCRYGIIESHEYSSLNGPLTLAGMCVRHRQMRAGRVESYQMRLLASSAKKRRRREEGGGPIQQASKEGRKRRLSKSFFLSLPASVHTGALLLLPLNLKLTISSHFLCGTYFVIYPFWCLHNYGFFS